jgi:hypothetical protein
VGAGGTQLPTFKLGWAREQALDVDAVSAACPDCKIIVVQAKTNGLANLGKAVNTAAAQAGVVAISNSYGSTGSDESDSTYGTYYHQPGIAVTASTGDNGYQGGSYPASSTYTTAVGGTSLVKATNTRGWKETAWSGAGSGCSTYNTGLPVQATFDTGCAMRAMADVACRGQPSQGWLGGLLSNQPDHLDLGAGGWHQRVVADYRCRVRARRSYPRSGERAAVRTFAQVPELALRHQGRQQRDLPRDSVVQCTSRLGRADGGGHAPRHPRVYR